MTLHLTSFAVALAGLVLTVGAPAGFPPRWRP